MNQQWKPRKGSLVCYYFRNQLIITEYLGTYSNGPRDTYAELANEDLGIPIEMLQKSPIKSLKDYK